MLKEAKSNGSPKPEGREGKPDPEWVEGPRRRRFTSEYKLRVLREAEACTKAGEIGALLRREGLYSSLLSEWRKQRDEGALAALERRRGRKKPIRWKPRTPSCAGARSEPKPISRRRAK